MRIGILGIGAVGGAFGGMLADKYHGADEAEIIFIAREKTAEVLREYGLKLITPMLDRTIHPDLVSSDPSEIEKLDLLICCTKSYDLADSLRTYRDCIAESTIILPLLNGVDGRDIIRSVLPDAEIWEGCVYIVSRLIQPGIVKDSGNIRRLHFGSATASAEMLHKVESIFSGAGIDTHLSEDIERTMWEKFLFISCAASLTTYYDRPIGEILGDKEQRKFLKTLLVELYTLALAKGIQFNPNILEKTLALMDNFPPGTTSSMHSDFKRGARTEYRSLTEYVVEQGKMLNVPTPSYKIVLEALKKKVR
jgi:2-dehydropantoate 2-reductase